MPIDYEIRDGVAWVKASGVLDDAAVLAHVRALLADPLHAPELPVLFDCTGISALELSGAGTRDAAALLRHAPGQPSARVALVVSGAAAYGMARMYGLLRDDIDVAVFADVDAAVAWLQAKV